MPDHRPPHLKKTLDSLPDLPGVYLMRDSEGEVIYVGKATSLKSRVGSYFQSPDSLLPKTQALVAKIVSLETIVTDSPTEALILECNLIKRYLPHYNISLRDDKRYPYLMITVKEDFPRLLVVRSVKNDGSRYFGPYVSATEMRRAQKLIEEIFPLRTCTAKTWHKNHRPCLNAHLGNCSAPCDGRISREEYLKTVEGITLFLQGRTKDILQLVEQRMYQAAEELRFEDAAHLREQLKGLKDLQKQQQLDITASAENRDMVAVSLGENAAVVQIFFVRQGKVVGREHFFLSNPSSEEAGEVMYRFLFDYYHGVESLPPEICINISANNKEQLQQLLSAKSSRRVSITVPQRGNKKRLLGLVEKNADLVLAQNLQSKERREAKAAEALEQLRLELCLPAAPCRMECYDISHIQGSYTVGSMVVFINGLPAPKEYRRFKIKTVEGIDDFASLSEVLRRRFTRAFKENDDPQSRFRELPDLIIIDGGKGQLSSVVETVKELDFPISEKAILEKIKIISLAKQFEEVYLSGRSEPLLLSRDSAALHTLQAIRDEAHRFAITFHRELRSKGQVRSELDAISGIGPKRKEKLLKIFRSVAGISKASVEELHQMGGLDSNTATVVHKHFHPENYIT